MSSRKLTNEQIEQACMLREQGVSAPAIIRRMRLPITPSALRWHFMVRGAERPNARLRQDVYAMAGQVQRRGDHVVRRYTPLEDEFIQGLALQGLTPPAIARRMTPQRRASSIYGRLATLARHDELRRRD